MEVTSNLKAVPAKVVAQKPDSAKGPPTKADSTKVVVQKPDSAKVPPTKADSTKVVAQKSDSAKVPPLKDAQKKASAIVSPQIIQDSTVPPNTSSIKPACKFFKNDKFASTFSKLDPNFKY